MRAIVVTMVVCLLAGCGSVNPYEPIKVSGKVTYEDGSPIPVPSMRLVFEPQVAPLDAKTYPRKGMVDVGADGTFDKVTTYKFGDGLIPGKHKVVIVPAESARATAQSTPAVPREYSDGTTTPLIVSTDELPLHIKIRKP